MKPRSWNFRPDHDTAGQAEDPRRLLVLRVKTKLVYMKRMSRLSRSVGVAAHRKLLFLLANKFVDDDLWLLRNCPF